MRAKKPREMEADLDMTTFINLMVVLLAFLLVTAVFTEVVRLNVNLPAAGAGGSADNKPPLLLEVSLYKDHIVVANQSTGPLKELPAINGQLDYKGLKAFLIQLKDEYPGVTDVSLLLEEDTPYDVLINGMDAVRYKPKSVNGKIVQAALFPDISIGNAIAKDAAAAPAGGTP